VINLNNYIASNEDLKTIEQGIELVWNPKLNFIFKDKAKIKNVAIISYDSKYIYLFQDRRLTKIPHRLRIKRDLHSWWRAGLLPESIEKYLPARMRGKSRFEFPIISGGLLTPFVELQKQKNQPRNPYVTRESYLATIIHEFGHVYYSNSGAKYWFSNKEENLGYLKTAIDLYNNKLVDLSNFKISIPGYQSLSELFAFCTDYTASAIFLPNHKRDIDVYNRKILSKLRGQEKHRNFNFQNSVMDDPHNFAFVAGKIILAKYPNTWPQKIIELGIFYI